MHLPNITVIGALYTSLILIVLVTIVGTARPPQSIVYKCCRNGEHLDRTVLKCAIGQTDPWFPRTYYIKKNTYSDPNAGIPRIFTIQEDTMPPNCQDPLVSSQAVAMFPNGSVFISDRGRFFDRDDFCLDNGVALYCLPQSPNSLVAAPTANVRKCCAIKNVYSQAEGKCIRLMDDHKLINKSVVNSNKLEILYGFPLCENSGHVIAEKFIHNKLDESSGNLTLSTGKELQSNEYCLDHTLNDLDSYVNVFTCAENVPAPQPAPSNPKDIRFVIYSTALLISVVFLCATLVAGFLLPSNHHVLHWRCQTYYVACLLIGDLMLAITQIFSDYIIPAKSTCFTFAIMMHFFFLAAFFWLNTMCFNIWWTFRDFRPTSLEKGQEFVRLRCYQVWAWGVPLLIAGVAAFLDYNGDGDFPRPRFAQETCWFNGEMGKLTYFFGPIGLLLFINLLLFASTTRQLTCGLWKRDDVKSTTERAALGRVCLKLVVVMGVTWIMDIISWAAGDNHVLWLIPDIVNALQGVLIFIVVGCQPQVWAAVKRIWSSKTRGVMNTTQGPQHSSSSHALPSIGETVTNNTYTNTTSSKIPMETIC